MKQLIFGTIMLLLSCPIIFGQETAKNCPQITVVGPNGVTQPGDTMTFIAEVKNFNVTDGIKYEWNLSAGTIQKGQGTSSIVVGTTQAMANSNVTATVRVGGIPGGCAESKSEVGSVAGLAQGSGPLHEFGKLNLNSVKVRIQNFYIRLQNEPSARGVIVNYGTPDQIKKRKKQIEKAITFLKFDGARVTMIDGPDQGIGINTKLWLVPAGASDPAI